MHLGVNLVWMLAFATPLARRFGPPRFLAFFAATAAAGAGAHLVTHPDAMVPMIGASASISGFMAAAVRFAFAPGASLSGRSFGNADRMPAQSLTEAFRDVRVLAFVGVWIGVNLLFGLGMSMPGTEDADVAWQAHMGGFFAGLLLFSLFDPVSAPGARSENRRLKAFAPLRGCGAGVRSGSSLHTDAVAGRPRSKAKTAIGPRQTHRRSGGRSMTVSAILQGKSKTLITISPDVS